MRFKIDFRLLGDTPFSIPVNYQNEIYAWLHKMLHFQDKKFTQWLSGKKFLDNNGEYKLFTFSDVFVSAHKVENQRIILESDTAELLLSFYAEKDIEPFILGIFKNQEFKIGDSKGKVTIKTENISVLDLPAFKSGEKIVFSCLSPMLIAEPGKNNENFLSPDQKDFDKVFFKSLMFKYANLIKYASGASGAGLSGLNDLQFKLMGKPKPRSVKIKTDTPHQKSVKGYMFDFEVKAPRELMDIGYNAGFGELNHLGFGCCKING